MQKQLNSSVARTGYCQVHTEAFFNVVITDEDCYVVGFFSHLVKNKSITLCQKFLRCFKIVWNNRYFINYISINICE